MICDKGIRHIDFIDLEYKYKEKYLHFFVYLQISVYSYPALAMCLDWLVCGILF